MPVKIEIKNSYVQEMIEFYLEKQKSLKVRMSEMEREVKEISSIIIQLKQAAKDADNSLDALITTNPNIDHTEYNEKWPWLKKIAFAIEKNDRALSTREIVDFLSEYEPEIIHERKKAIASVSSILSVRSSLPSGEKKDFLKHDSETGEFAYDLWKEPEVKLSYDASEDLPF